jgi:(p)ppGpp synthase/HD superfamily hydrolase
MAFPPLGPRFAEALGFAAELHAEQLRKGSRVPYVAHLLAVAALVLEDGGGETEAIAALLHDAVEDQGGQPTLAEIRRRFGAEVASIVEACSDTTEDPKPPWRGRKESYIAHLRSAPEPVRRVSNADKLHNARSLVADYRNVGEQLWERFNAGRDETLWYYRSLIEVFRETGGGAMTDELDRQIAELERLIRENGR